MNQKDLKGLREKKGLSQPEVAEMIGVSERTYRRWENQESKASRDMMSALWPILNDAVL